MSHCLYGLFQSTPPPDDEDWNHAIVSIHAPPKGERRPDGARCARLGKVSIHALRKGGEP